MNKHTLYFFTIGVSIWDFINPTHFANGKGIENASHPLLQDVVKYVGNANGGNILWEQGIIDIQFGIHDRFGNK
jgi:hypothetical protein